MPTFEWDENNVEHLAHHGITPQEVQELYDGRIVHRRGGTRRPGRVRILGRTASGRYLALVIEPKEGDLIRPFTGWEMEQHERELYGRQVND